ncbi:oxidoreductase [Streptomyces sp. TRM43335]|uniref:Oxidoreductase n=1 Tax=Streptomyces taklimakanensis TaxID=2569853 RepID=A0A6G2B7U8_9ACTN|nr:FMN reductase [Streptomyces taklimakanensis]MTE17982.1 oxidoreductase [Streptomyces taklimakanensis]
MKPIRLVAVSAGLGRPSTTRLLADRLAEAARRSLAEGERPVETRVVELRDLAGDIANNLVTGFPAPALREVVEAVAEADGLVAVTPVFTASYSGLFKSFFDVVDKDALRGTPVLVAATGGTPRHSLVLDHAMRPLFAYLGAPVVPTGVYAASEDWGGGGDGESDELSARIRRAGEELADAVAARPPRPAGSAERGEAVTPFAEQLASLGLD